MIQSTHKNSIKKPNNKFDENNNNISEKCKSKTKQDLSGLSIKGMYSLKNKLQAFIDFYNSSLAN